MLASVDLEPCDEESNHFNYVPRKTSPQGTVDGDEVVIQPNTSLLVRHTAELQIPDGTDFTEFLNELTDLEESERDCLTFKLSFTSGEKSYTAMFDKRFYLRPMREELARHWRAHDFEQGLKAVGRNDA